MVPRKGAAALGCSRRIGSVLEGYAPFRAVARVSRYVPLRFTSRDTRRPSHEPHEKGAGVTSVIAIFEPVKAPAAPDPNRLSPC